MYTPGSLFASDNRRIDAKILINEVEADASIIKSFNITESAGSGNCISMGTTNSAKIDLELVGAPKSVWYNLYKGKRFKVLIRAGDSHRYDDYISLGYFVVDDVEWTLFHNNSEIKNGKITGYDFFCLTEKEFKYTPGQGNTISTLINSICQGIGITKGSGWTNLAFTEVPTDISVRTMIGYLAGLQGCIAYFDRQGHLSAKWYTSCNKQISTSEIYADEFVDNGENAIDISYLESGTQDNVITVPTGTGVIGKTISFENPMMTEEILTNIYNEKFATPFSFKSYTVKWRGDPNIELCEKLWVAYKPNAYTPLVLMEREIHYDGGLYEVYKSYGQNEKTISFSTSPVLQKVERRLSSMEQAIIDATEILNGAEALQSGTFTIIPSDDGTRNVGWKIESNVDNNYILANKNGIGFSTNGGNSFDAAAIYIDSDGGHINGNYIVANSITANQISFDSAFSDSLQNTINEGGIEISQSSITGLSEDLAALVNVSGSALTNSNNAVSRMARYVTCSTPSDEFIKECYLADNQTYYLSNGSTITVKFDYTGYNNELEEEDNLQIKLCYANGTEISTAPISYNDSYVMPSSVEAWSEGGLVSFVYSNGNWIMQDNVANTMLSDWCMANDRTYINGAYIATGTVEAAAIRAGVVAGRTDSGEYRSNTYLDLDNSMLFTGSMADCNIRIKSGGIDAYYQDMKLGTFAPTYHEDDEGDAYGEKVLSITYNPANAECLSLGAENTNGSFRDVAIVKSANDIGGSLAVQGEGEYGISYQRWIAADNNGYQVKNAKLGIVYDSYWKKYGVVIKCDDLDTTDTNAVAQLEIYPGDPEYTSNTHRRTAVCIKGKFGNNESGVLRMSSQSISYNGMLLTRNSEVNDFIRSYINNADNGVITTSNIGDYISGSGSSGSGSSGSGSSGSDGGTYATELYVQNFASNASNITTGTINNARLPSYISTHTWDSTYARSKVYGGYGEYNNVNTMYLFDKNYIQISYCRDGTTDGASTYRGIEIIPISGEPGCGTRLIVTGSGTSASAYLQPVNGTAYMHYLGSANSRWYTAYLKSSPNVGSDARTKRNIEDISNTYECMFDKLRPVTYKRIDGERTHIGFVAQEVESAMEESGLTDMDFAGLCKDYTDENDPENATYGLRYEEFIALCVDKIQKLEKRIEELENR